MSVFCRKSEDAAVMYVKLQCCNVQFNVNYPFTYASIRLTARFLSRHLLGELPQTSEVLPQEVLARSIAA